MINAVYDVNVFISGLFWPGIPRQLIHVALDGKVQVITCQAILDDIKSVLMRPNKSFKFDAEQADRVIADVLNYARVIETTSEVSVCRDADDNIVLACALDGQANYVVTGDLDLLALKKFEGVEIITPRKFFEVLHA